MAKPKVGTKKSVAAKPAITRAVKPARPSKPSLPLPPPPPPPPATRDELAAPKDVARLLRYGERFGPTSRIDVRMLPLVLPVTGTALAIMDPSAPKKFVAFDRPTGAGQFRVMLSVAITESKPERLAAIVIHLGRPPIARWTVAHHAGQNKPKSPDALPRIETESGWIALVDARGGSPGVLAVPATATGVTPIAIPLTDGRTALAIPSGKGAFAAYWAVDAADKPICLVIDFDAFSQKDWKVKG